VLNDTLAGALVGGGLALVGVLVGRLLEEVFRSRREEKSRKSSLSALWAEAQTTMHGLRGLLEISEKSGHANIAQFLRLVGHQASAGSMLLGLLPNLGMLSPSLVHRLAAAYMKVRVAAQMGQALAAKKEDIITGGEVDRVREQVRTALAALEHVEADLGRSVS
jgi:hypothetical protein